MLEAELGAIKPLPGVRVIHRSVGLTATPPQASAVPAIMFAKMRKLWILALVLSSSGWSSAAEPPGDPVQQPTAVAGKTHPMPLAGGGKGYPADAFLSPVA